jgi:arginyl-tRNA synthetase
MILSLLQAAVDSALAELADKSTFDGVSPDALLLTPATNPQFGDYQFNGALALAKPLKQKPRQIAIQLVEKLNVADWCESLEIAGPGFINFRLKRESVAEFAVKQLQDAHLGIAQAENPRTVVVDFSSPNVAKPMHVGHIRSTVLGDALARLLRSAGHNVITDNHLGDWGTQFGKIIYGWKNYLDKENLAKDPIGEMERLYKTVNAQSETDETIADAARAETAKLQNGDAENLKIWNQLRAYSQQQFDEMYGRLNIKFDHTLGESFYNDELAGVVEDLKQKGLAKNSEGAIIVSFDDISALADKPMLIQKRDGSFLYGTTDLATIRYRENEWHADEILYVVDARQSLHFQQLFETSKRANYTNAQLRHISFGSILGEDGTPIKTRSGESVKLRDLLDEAEARALEIVQEKNASLDSEIQKQVAKAVGIGAIKYADLSQNRVSDYIFSWERMLAMQGNTAPYLLYAYVRIRSIMRQSESTFDARKVLLLEENAEFELAKFALRFGEAVETSLKDYRPNALCEYLFHLAQKFTAFYDACPVRYSEEPLRSSRLQLCQLTADILQRGLGLLGIETVEQM